MLSLFLFCIPVLFLLPNSVSECTNCANLGINVNDANLTVHDYALEGYNSSSIFVHGILECLAECTHNECRCTSFNFQNTPQEDGLNQCEMNYETKTSKPTQLQKKPGYTYYELKLYKQEFCERGCTNACCATNPCLNNGVCVEQCQDIYRIRCACPNGVTGRLCEKKRTMSCQDVMRHNTTATDGYYSVEFTDVGILKIFCQFDNVTKTAWALVNSFKFSQRKKYRNQPFTINFPINETSPNFEDYRLSLYHMTALKSYSSHWRATCNFDQQMRVNAERMRGRFTSVDILSILRKREGCKALEYIDIGELKCSNCTTVIQQTSDSMARISIAYSGIFNCDFYKNGIGSNHYFGYYGKVPSNFGCVSSKSATTQWWIGGPIND